MDVTGYDSRRNKVLEIIVNAYVNTAQPVGSRSVSRQFEESLSPATIRNVMADLEELGYIMQPHTSAGRVPTDKGYRFYVDALMGSGGLEEAERLRIQQGLVETRRQLDELIGIACRFLSDLTQQASVFLYPKLKKAVLKDVELIPIDLRRVLLLLVTTSGLVNEAIVAMRHPVPGGELERLSRMLAQELAGKEISEAIPHLRRLLAESVDQAHELLQEALALLEGSGLLKQEPRLAYEGASFVLEKPEFRDIEQMRSFLRALDRKEELLSILSGDLEGGRRVGVHIGAENPFADLRQMSIIVSPYHWEDEVVGMLGVIGPTRMEYARLVPVVEAVARVFSEALGRVEEL